jgi:hypothetical protein
MNRMSSKIAESFISHKRKHGYESRSKLICTLSKSRLDINAIRTPELVCQVPKELRF